MSAELVPARREPSINDVASEAGVSAQTVSRVANGKDIVRPETRDRVVAAMQKLGYRPNRAARSLKYGRYRNIGVIMFSLSSFGNMHTLEAIANEATAADYTLTLIPLQAATRASVSGAFARLSEQAVDGIVILIEAQQLDESDLEMPIGVPVVVVDSNPLNNLPFVDTDQAQGARLATRHLLELGHITVSHVAGPARSYSASRRREAWERTLVEHGAPVPTVIQGDWTAEAGYEAGLVLAADASVTAVFTANDQMALGVMRALHEAGRSVPGDVSIVGFDDMPESANFWPPLTTVRQHFDRVGVAAIHAIIAEIEGERFEKRDLVPTELVVRASTSVPPDR